MAGRYQDFFFGILESIQGYSNTYYSVDANEFQQHYLLSDRSSMMQTISMNALFIGSEFRGCVRTKFVSANFESDV